MMDGGRLKSPGRMVDRAWCQAIIFKTANNLERVAMWKRVCVVINKFESLVYVNGWPA